MTIRLKHWAVASLLVAASCAHNNNLSSRLPASETLERLERAGVPSGVLAFQKSAAKGPASEAVFCGYLDSAESYWNAVDNDHSAYVVNVDCANTAEKSGRAVVAISRDNLSAQQKGWIPRWRKAAVEKQKNRRALPYLCFRGQVDQPVCGGSKTSYSELVSVQNITSVLKTYQSWR
jgi:hypothetical protein